MKKEDIIQKVLGYNMNPQDTYKMLQSVENIPVNMLDRIVGISPESVVVHNDITTTTSDGTGIVDRWDTSTSIVGNVTTTGTVTTKYVTETGTWDKAFAEEQNRRQREELLRNCEKIAPEEFNWSGVMPPEEAPKPRRARKAKPKVKPIVVKPRNPGERRIVLED